MSDRWSSRRWGRPTQVCAAAQVHYSPTSAARLSRRPQGGAKHQSSSKMPPTERERTRGWCSQLCGGASPRARLWTEDERDARQDDGDDNISIKGGPDDIRFKFDNFFDEASSQEVCCPAQGWLSATAHRRCSLWQARASWTARSKATTEGLWPMHAFVSTLCIHSIFAYGQTGSGKTYTMSGMNTVGVAGVSLQ